MDLLAEAGTGWPAVAGLLLPGRTSPDLAARAIPGLQPVAEFGGGDLLKQPDVALQAREQGLPLLPGKGLARARIALQDPF